MRKPESRFIASVHSKMRVIPHHEKMHNPYLGGTWDVWYSGHKSDLWIEYKWLNRTPTRGLVIPALSALQLNWGLCRKREGRQLVVIIGTPDAGIWLDCPQHWIGGIHVKAIEEKLLSRSDIAERIGEMTGRAHDPRKSIDGSEDGGIAI